MKTKILLIIFLITVIVFNLHGQTIFLNDFETWAGNVPSNWLGSKTNLESDSISPYSISAHSGIYSCRLVNRESIHKRFSTQALSIISGLSYNVSFWIRGHGSIRVGLYDGATYAPYNNYIVINSLAWSLQTQSVIATNTSSLAEFILSVQLTYADNDDIQIDDVTITTGAVNNVTIHDIQYTVDVSGDSPYNNQSVNTMGIVTAKNSQGFYLQDGNGAWNGVYVYSIPYAGTVNIGDVLSLTGTVSEYFNNTQIQNLTECTIVYSGATPPNPSIISAALANMEQYEGILVQVLNAFCVELPDPYGAWKLYDGDTIRIGSFFYPYTPVLFNNYTVTGPLEYYFGSFTVLPRNISDIIVNPFPGAAGSITGDNSVCQGQNNVTYKVQPIANATSYVWTLPPGTTGASSIDSIIVNYGMAASTGFVTVKGQNYLGYGAVSTLQIFVYDKPPTPIIIQNGTELHSDAIYGNQWYNQNGLLDGDTNQNYIPLIDGSYYVVVTINGCNSEYSNSINVVINGIGFSDLMESIEIFPNPVIDEMIIDIQPQCPIENFEIYNFIGQSVYNASLSGKTTINTSCFSPGVYFIKLENSESWLIKKIIKE